MHSGKKVAKKNESNPRPARPHKGRHGAAKGPPRERKRAASGASSPTMQAVDLVDDDPIARLISLTQTQASNASQDQSGGQRDIQNQNQNTDQTGSGN